MRNTFAPTKPKSNRTMKSKKPSESTIRFRRTIMGTILTPTSIQQLAAECGLCTTKFKKEFCRIFGDTPHRWILRRRLELSKRILVHTDLPVKSVARQVQFATSSHFIRLFKAEFGITPIGYRRLHQQEGVDRCGVGSCGECLASLSNCCCNNIRTGRCPRSRRQATLIGL